MKKLFAFITALAMLAGGFALPGHAAGDGLAVAFETAQTRLSRGDAFSVDVSITPAGAGVSALRLYVLYDSGVLEYTGAAEHFSLVDPGMYALREAAGEPEKCPATLPAGKTAADYNALVIQWCAVPTAGDLPEIPAGARFHALTLGFSVKADAPYAQPGGKIFVSTDYSYADTPWFHAGDLAIDASAASLSMQPIPPAPVMSTDLTIDGDFIYGFPDDMPQVGGVNPWRDGDLGLYFTATNDGYFELIPPAYSLLAGTGTALKLWNANGTVLCGEYSLIVFGDLDGNFVIDFDDWALLKGMAHGPVGTDPMRLAADLNNDGVIDGDDLQLLYDAARGASTISQTR